VIPLLAEERAKGTEAVLLTQPVTRAQVWRAKAAGAFLMAAMAGAPVVAVTALANSLVDRLPLATVGVALLALAGMVPIGLFASALADSASGGMLYALLGGAFYGAVIFRLAMWATTRWEQMGAPDPHLASGLPVLAGVLVLLAAVPCLLGSYLAVTRRHLGWWRGGAVVLAGWLGATLVCALPPVILMYAL